MSKIKYCHGCYNDFYNHRENICGKGCWFFKDAKVVWRQKVHINQLPPFKNKRIRTLDCYREPQYVMLKTGASKQ